MGRGEMRFEPGPETEKGQVRIFTGDTKIESRFDAAFVRVGAIALHANPDELVPMPVDARELRRAEEIFRVESAKSYALELGDLSSDNWSLSPAAWRFRRGNADQPVRNAHLRAQPQRARGHQRLQSPPRAQHLRLHVAGAARHPRSFLQRGRAGRLRRPRLRHRHRRGAHAGPSVARRPHHAPHEGAGALDVAGVAAAGRFAHRALGRERPIRPPLQPARAQPEHRAGQPPLHAAAGRGVDADRHLQRAAGAAGSRTGDDRCAGRRTAARRRPVEPDDRSQHPDRRAKLSVQQPEQLVPAAADFRLRDRADPHHGAGHAWVCGNRRARGTTRRPAASGGRRRRAVNTSSSRRGRFGTSRSSPAGSHAPTA